MRILIVDDHTVVRKGIIEIINETVQQVDNPILQPAEFDEAGSTAEALELVRQQTYDLLIVDISLPDVSGLDLIREIRDEVGQVPILVLSMHPEESYAIRAFRVGANGYLNKASVPEELKGAIEKVLSGGTYASPNMTEALVKELSDANEIKHPHETLSEREWQVLRLLARGKKLTTIAELLNLHPKTVSTYKTRLMKKLQVENNAELIHYVMNQDLMG